MNGGHQEINQIRRIVETGQLLQCTEGQLLRMCVVIDHYESCIQPHMTAGIKEPVLRQLERVQSERHHAEAQRERNRVYQEQAAEVKRMFLESAVDSDKKHAQSLAVSQEANALSKRAVRVAWISFWTATGLGVVSFLGALLYSTRTAISDARTIETKTPALPPAMPQIVSPMPLPTPTNLIATNAAPKK